LHVNSILILSKCINLLVWFFSRYEIDLNCVRKSFVTASNVQIINYLCNCLYWTIVILSHLLILLSIYHRVIEHIHGEWRFTIMLTPFFPIYYIYSNSVFLKLYTIHILRDYISRTFFLRTTYECPDFMIQTFVFKMKPIFYL